MGPANRPPENSDDAAVIRAVLAGEVDAFALLLDRYQDFIGRLVMKYVPSEHAAEVAHDVFVRAFQSLGSFRGSSPVKPWLARIAVRCCYDFWRGRYRRPEIPESALSPECRTWLESLTTSGEADPPEEALIRREAQELLGWALGQLSPGQRLALTLTYLEELPVREALARLGWSVARVKVEAYRARKKLRRILAQMME